MKIAFLNLYQKTTERGSETFVSELSKRLKSRHEVEIISGSEKLIARWPILWRAFLDPSGLIVFWFTIRTLPKLWKEKYNIVVPLNGGWQPALVRILTWLYGGKMVISGQSGKGWDDRNNLWCFPDYFLGLSTRLSDWARRANPFVRVSYIPNGVDLGRFTPDGREMDFGLERPIILAVGALTADKRLDLTIKAVARLKNASLVICGKGELENDLLGMGKNLLGKRFKLTSVPFDSMPDVYRSANLFTLPSAWFRSFEIVLVEAMATNLAVVANRDPIRQEIVENGGILVDPTDTRAYAEALKKALKKDWGEIPRKQAEKFSWDYIADKYEDLFLSLNK
jgi:glycosyltransferase involved in cell wall biosynthesis